MALLNYSSPFLATPAPLNSFFQPPLLPQSPHHTPYTYPVPQKPFLAEEYPQARNHQANRQQQQNGQYQGPYDNQQPQQPYNQPLPNQQFGNAQPFSASQVTNRNQQRANSANNVRGNQNTNNAHNGPYSGYNGADNGHNGGGDVQFTRVTEDGAKTKVHAVIDYDYDDGDDQGFLGAAPPVTPIQGPIYAKNGSVPVVPLYSHPMLNNGTFVQIPILWTALSVALGLELRGEYIRGVPCIKRHQQLFCPTAGNNYPLDRIEVFIDENKALMRRMYGEFEMPEYEDTGPYPPSQSYKRKRDAKHSMEDLHFDPEDTASDSFIKKIRKVRQNFKNPGNPNNESGRVDACEAKTEIVTPYWASNSAGKIRAIVNTQHFEQAIHQEVCAKTSTKRCTSDCGCEQKYKWHRLLAYDPDNDCKGIFMDWFLFPSCCVCRCNP